MHEEKGIFKYFYIYNSFSLKIKKWSKAEEGLVENILKLCMRYFHESKLSSWKIAVSYRLSEASAIPQALRASNV